MGLSYMKDVAKLTFDADRCTGCRRCLEVCPHDVFEAVGRKVQLKDRNSCMECGACALNCPTAAIKVEPGVGCASAIIKSWFTGEEPSCDCGSSDCC